MFHKQDGKLKLLTVFTLLLFVFNCKAQSWADSLDQYAREKFLPAKKYQWQWTHAALMNAFIRDYDLQSRAVQMEDSIYAIKAMKHNLWRANGKSPNSVASATALAFLFKISGDSFYLHKAEKIYSDYLKIRRTKEGAVSHLMLFTELWDDTIFMVGEYLLEMYAATGDEKYLVEFMKQFRLHRDKLRIKEWGLWVHGWDSDNKTHCTFCSQMNWADKKTRRSSEAWGRGNGWIVVTLSDALDIIPESNAYHAEVAGYLKEMLQRLPELQDSSGLWHQLPIRKNEEGNWLESSCTAMFAYGIQKGLSKGIVSGSTYSNAVTKAYEGLSNYSIVPVKDGYVSVGHVCTGTCIGDRYYYFKRKQRTGTGYGLGMAIRFGLSYNYK